MLKLSVWQAYCECPAPGCSLLHCCWQNLNLGIDPLPVEWNIDRSGDASSILVSGLEREKWSPAAGRKESSKRFPARKLTFICWQRSKIQWQLQVANKWLNDWNLKIVLFFINHMDNPLKYTVRCFYLYRSCNCYTVSVVQRFYHLKNKPCIL